MIQLNVKLRDQVTPRLTAATRKMRDTTPVLMVAGRACANFTRWFYKSKNVAEPNRLGGKRTNFWADVGRSVQNPQKVRQGLVSVEVTHPNIAQKVLGGEIVPKVAKWLTIPANPIAHGKRAKSFKLRFAVVDGRPALVAASAMKRAMRWKTQRDFGMGIIGEIRQKVKLAEGDVVFWLIKKAIQKPWPNSIPNEAALNLVALRAVIDWLDDFLAKETGTA